MSSRRMRPDRIPVPRSSWRRSWLATAAGAAITAAVLAAPSEAHADCTINGANSEDCGGDLSGYTHGLNFTSSNPDDVLATMTVNIHDATTPLTTVDSLGGFGVFLARTMEADPFTAGGSGTELSVTADDSLTVNVTSLFGNGIRVLGRGSDFSAPFVGTIAPGPDVTITSGADVNLNSVQSTRSRAQVAHETTLRDQYAANVALAQNAVRALNGEYDPLSLISLQVLYCRLETCQIDIPFGDPIPIPPNYETLTPKIYDYLAAQTAQLTYWDAPQPPEEVSPVDISAALRAESYGGYNGVPGAGGQATVTNTGTLTTNGANAFGILALSIANQTGPTVPGGGVAVTNDGAIVTYGASSAGIFARSTGSDSEIGGQGGLVTVGGTGSITTNEATAYGIYAASLGGMGTTLDGTKKSGDGGVVTVDYSGAISTEGLGAIGIYATSVGNVGHVGGDASSGDPANFGNPGGSGGHATAILESTGSITTIADNATAILVTSFGGAGGKGGHGVDSGGGHAGASGGLGGNGGEASAWNHGQIATGGDDAYGIFVQSLAGNGGEGGDAHVIFLAHAGDGGQAGFGGDVDAHNDGRIVTTGDRAFGIFAESIGGQGGAGGGAGGIFVSHGGDGGSVFVGECNPLTAVCPNGGDVTVDNAGQIHTSGFGAYTIFAQSIGGGGGQGGNANGWINVSGGGGGNAGSGGIVTVTNEGELISTGDKATAIFAQSIGGGGGNGGDAVSTGAFAAVAVGGNGGAGGDGGEVHVTNSGTIDVSGERTDAILAQSVGGGGGVGGSATSYAFGIGGAASVAIGGSGANGGDGDWVEVKNEEDGDISTHGDFSVGIFAQSVGGGGGQGGSAFSFSAAGGAEDFNMAASISVGGSGATGGKGGLVHVENSGSITTYDFNSEGVFAQSVGGGGGAGGSSMAKSVTATAGEGASFNVSIAVGGPGGAGGDGGIVNVENYGSILTYGDGSTGVFAQSVGGGGGTGGDASTTSAAFSTGESTSLELTISLGGDGGAAGDGNTVTVKNFNTITTLGSMANGVTAQSVGGGGGIGGAGDQSDLFEDVDIPTEPPDTGDDDESEADRRNTRDRYRNLQNQAANAPETEGSHGRKAKEKGAGPPSTGLALSLGGDGGAGGDGMKVTVENSGEIVTGGFMSMGVFAQSVGGGGGAGGGGSASANGDVSLGAGLGGEGAAAGNGGEVSVTNTGAISTLSAMSYGIFAQSVGGGGGLAGVGAGEGEGDIHLTLGAGGDAGSGGHSELVHVEQTGDVITLGYASIGVFAQSVGGGGGVGGAAEQGTYGSIALGGAGGVGSDGGPVEVIVTGDIATEGDYAHGVFAQSVGGGGGLAGGVSTSTYSVGIDPFGQLNVDTGIVISAGNFGMGGNGGAGGSGKNVTVTSNGSISTFGTGAHGIYAQSVGGGGGAGGSSGSADIDLSIGIAGSSGGQGTAGTVSITHTGDIHTFGAGTAGIYAQSMNGTQGTGLDATFDGRGSDITITLNGGTIEGGSGPSGVGVFISGGAHNELHNNGGDISALSGVAIAGTDGDDIVLNTGRIAGNVGLGSGANVFNNLQGGLFESGSAVYVGVTLNNAGVMSPFGAGHIGETVIAGDYAQSATGDLLVDFNFTSPSDHITVQGDATLGGTVTPLIGHVSGVTENTYINVLQADAITNNGISIDHSDTLVLDYATRVAGGNFQIGLAHVNFTPHGLSETQQTIANNFQEIWKAGGSPALDPVMDYLAAQTSIAPYATLMDNLHPHSAFSQGPSSMLSNIAFLDGMLSCPGAYDSDDMHEQSCIWVRSSEVQATQSASSLGPRNTDHGHRYQGGAQFARDGWIGGVSIGAENSSYRIDGTAWAQTDTTNIGAVLKRELGPWTIAGAVDYARGDVDRSRMTGFPALVEATSKNDVSAWSGRLRVSYLAQSGGWYVRPAVDLDVYRLHTDAFNESGAGALDMQVVDSEQTLGGAAMSIEAGLRYHLTGAVLHPYVQLGETFLSTDSLDVDARFEGAPSGSPTFTVSTPIPDTLVRGLLGFEAQLSFGSLRLEYQAQEGDAYRDRTATAKLRIDF